jgi:SIR2-like domain
MSVPEHYSGDGSALPQPDLISPRRQAGERDIDIVLVTGAGASCAFGVNGTRLPLMGDWSDKLVRALGQRIGYREATGLQQGMSGEEFEAQLGKFLQDVEAFKRIGGLLAPSVGFQDFGAATQIMASQGVMGQWHSQAVSHFSQITALIHQSLYENFADAAVDLDAAARAYERLFHSLGLGGAGSRLVYATTNYDTIGEYAIERSGGHPDWGQPPSLENRANYSLTIPGLLDAMPRYVPVLHLHGRVGWYRRDGKVYAANVVKHQPGFGVPVVMLPDPDKIYDQDDVIIAICREFSEALSRAKRVLVLGHSLHDRYLVQTIAQHVEPLDRLAVTVLVDPADPARPHKSVVSFPAKIAQLLGNAAIIPMRFGSGEDAGVPAIRTWTETLASGGLL